MSTSWLFIILVNIGWVGFLYLKRRENHPWLFPFFLLATIADVVGWLLSPPGVGGADLLSATIVGSSVWVVAVAACWLSWFLLVFLAAARLYLHKLPKALVVVLVGLTTAVALTQGAEAIPAVHRRAIMHFLLEPLLLLGALVFLSAHYTTAIQRGRNLDYMCYVVAVSIFCLGLKLIVMLDSNLLLLRRTAHAYYYIHIFALVGAYFVDRKVSRWLLQ